MPTAPEKKGNKRRILGGIALTLCTLFCGLLGYGYLSAIQSGWLGLYLYNSAAQGPNRRVHDARLRFLDHTGKLLAEGKTDLVYGIVYLNHPTAGYCEEATHALKSQLEQRKAWKPCHAALSSWIVKWGADIAAIDLQAGPCTIRQIPVKPRIGRGDWWLWWVPLPHIGGKPYTTYSMSLAFDPDRCVATAR